MGSRKVVSTVSHGRPGCRDARGETWRGAGCVHEKTEVSAGAARVVARGLSRSQPIFHSPACAAGSSRGVEGEKVAMEDAAGGKEGIPARQSERRSRSGRLEG